MAPEDSLTARDEHMDLVSRVAREARAHNLELGLDEKQREIIKRISASYRDFVKGYQEHILPAGQAVLHGARIYRSGMAIVSPHEPYMPGKGRFNINGTWGYWPNNRVDGEELSRGPATSVFAVDVMYTIRDDMAIGMRLPFVTIARNMLGMDNRQTGIADMEIGWKWWITQKRHLVPRTTNYDFGVDVSAILPTGDPTEGTSIGTGQDQFFLRFGGMFSVAPYKRGLPRVHARISRASEFDSDVSLGSTEIIFGGIWNWDAWRNDTGSRHRNWGAWVDVAGTFYDEGDAALTSGDDNEWEMRFGGSYMRLGESCRSVNRCRIRHVFSGEIQRRLDSDGLYSSMSGLVSYGLTF